jgi:hypothetical protein
MESRTAEVPFKASWNALLSVASKPDKLFSTFPYRASVSGQGGKPLVRFSFRRFLTKFEFEGRMEFTFNEPHITYIVKGQRGLLILSFAAVDGKLVLMVSADIPGERALGKKLGFLAEGSALAGARIAESQQIVSTRGVGSALEFKIENFNASLLPHIVRYARFHTGKPSFEVVGENGHERFTIKVKDDFVKRVEYEFPTGSSIIEVGRNMLEVEEGDFEGVELLGEYKIRVVS